MTTNTLQGIDVSDHNGQPQWARVKTEGGISFAMVKATEGAGFVAPSYAANMAGARAAGIVVGAYHFFHYDIDPVAQADLFIKTIGHVQAGDLPPAVDVEAPGDGNGASQGVTENIRRLTIMLARVEAQTGRRPMIYTYPYAWVQVMGNTKQFADYPLWIASYGTPKPTLPGGWTSHAIWQYSSTGRVAGIGPIVDLNVFAGTSSDLQTFCGVGTPAPQIPPKQEGPPMTQETINGHVVFGNIYKYWAANGRVPEFGLPISDEFTQHISGQDYRVQYFERARLECDARGNVTRGLVGAELFARVRGEIGYAGA